MLWQFFPVVSKIVLNINIVLMLRYCMKVRNVSIVTILVHIYSGGQNDSNTIFSAAKNGLKTVISIFCCSVDAHTKCGFHLVNRSSLIKKIYSWHYFWPHPHFTAFLSKTFNSTVALQEVSWSVLRHSSSGFSLSLFCFFMWLQTDWWWSDQSTTISLDYYN